MSVYAGTKVILCLGIDFWRFYALLGYMFFMWYALIVYMTTWETLFMLEIMSRLLIPYLDIMGYFVCWITCQNRSHTCIHTYIHPCMFISLSIWAIHTYLLFIYIHCCIWISNKGRDWHDVLRRAIDIITARWFIHEDVMIMEWSCILCGLMIDFWGIGDMIIEL